MADKIDQPFPSNRIMRSQRARVVFPSTTPYLGLAQDDNHFFKKGLLMKNRLLTLCASVYLIACGQDKPSTQNLNPTASQSESTSVEANPQNLTELGQPTAENELSSLRSNTADLTLAPPLAKTIKGQDAKTMVTILKRSGLGEQASIETTFFNAEEVICVSGVNPDTQLSIKICQFSVGGGLFVRASSADSDAFIKLIRKAGATSTAVTSGRRWDLLNLECSTRFDLNTRKLLSTCTFLQ